MKIKKPSIMKKEVKKENELLEVSLTKEFEKMEETNTTFVLILSADTDYAYIDNVIYVCQKFDAYTYMNVIDKDDYFKLEPKIERHIPYYHPSWCRTYMCPDAFTANKEKNKILIVVEYEGMQQRLDTISNDTNIKKITVGFNKYND